MTIQQLFLFYIANHFQAITISGVLGIGLYVQGGMILRLGGPLAVLLSFALLGLLAWAVMQCIAEMLCIWPISGALAVYVSEFVDVELGIAVGVAYWYVSKNLV
jgi:amino acid transporter